MGSEEPNRSLPGPKSPCCLEGLSGHMRTVDMGPGDGWKERRDGTTEGFSVEEGTLSTALRIDN